MASKEFEIKSLPEVTFRTTKVSPIDLLAITTQIDFDKYLQTREFYKFALEHCEVKVGEQWFAVKVPEKEFYAPAGIEENLTALNEIITFFLTEVVMPAFQKSSE